MKHALVIQNLHAALHGKPILSGVNLVVPTRRCIALMGPNASGKSTLAHVLMGNPLYEVTQGKILWQGKDLVSKKPWERAQQGIFLSFQNPVEVPGVNLETFLLAAYQSVASGKASQGMFDRRIAEAKKFLNITDAFLQRSLHEGFSGGEKKRAEMLQLFILRPKIAIMDEIDSGLDIDSLKLVAKSIQKLRASGMGFLVITHYQRLLHYLHPDEVQVLMDGDIVFSGDSTLVKTLEKHGYAWVKQQLAINTTL